MSDNDTTETETTNENENENESAPQVNENGWRADMFYKIINSEGNPVNGGFGTWKLPVPDENGPMGAVTPGEWMPLVERVEACSRGYHLCHMEDVREWCSNSDASSYELCVYWAEGRGENDPRDNKVAFAEARLLKLVLGPKQWWGLCADFFEYVKPAWAAIHTPDSTALYERLITALRSIKVSRDEQGAQLDALYDALDAYRESAEARATAPKPGNESMYYYSSYTHGLIYLASMCVNACEDTTGFYLYSNLSNNAWDVGAQIVREVPGMNEWGNNCRDFIDSRYFAYLRSETPAQVVPIEVPVLAQPQ